jgi:hypothetical protein
LRRGGVGVLKVFWSAGRAVSVLSSSPKVRQELTVGLKGEKDFCCSSEMFVARREKEAEEVVVDVALPARR